MKVLTRTYGFEIAACIALNDSDEPIGGIGFCHVQDLLGERIVALPFSDYFDPLVENKEVWDALVAKITEKNLTFTIRCLHNSTPLTDNRFVDVKKAKWHGLTLHANCDAHWNVFASAVRRNIRKAIKDGVSIAVTSDKEALEKFFHMHVRVRKYKYKLLAQPYTFFENIWNCFLEEGKFYLLVALYKKEIVASTLFLGWGNTLYYKFNASEPNYLNHRPNDLIVWEAIKLALSNGYQNLDFGLSDLDQDGLIRFKRQFGAEEKEIVHLTYPQGPINGDPSVTEKKKLLGNLTRLLTEKSVPDDITAQGGELLYKFFT
jgi:CelD/BcsL family acetyltransferase involved in cellulose biosynthesis